MKFTSRIQQAALVAALFAASHAIAAPGAHGPDGQHLDGPAAQTSGGDSAPRFETRSETFELVGRLAGGELSMFINRYENSEPVDNAKVELEAGQAKATATFQKDQGSYVVSDAAFVKSVSAPGSHALVVMVTAGAEADLLDASWTVAGGAAAHGHDHDGAHDDHHSATEIVLWGAGAVAVLSLLGWLVFRRPRNPSHGTTGGAQ